MATDINVVTLSGRLTNDGQARQFDNGGIVNFDIAVNRSQKGADGQYTNVASFFSVNYSSKGAAKFAEYLKKGTQVMVSGYLIQETWEDKQTGQKKSAIKIRANDVVLCGGSGNTQNNQYAQPQQYQQYQQPQQQYQQMPKGVQQGFSQQPQQQQFQQPQFIQNHQVPQQSYNNAPLSLENFPDQVPF